MFLQSDISTHSLLKPIILGHEVEQLPSESRTLTAVVPISCRATGVKSAVLMNVNRDVEDIWVFVERFLNSIP